MSYDEFIDKCKSIVKDYYNNEVIENDYEDPLITEDDVKVIALDDKEDNKITVVLTDRYDNLYLCHCNPYIDDEFTITVYRAYDIIHY